MTEQSKEKFLWIFRSGHRDHPWGRNNKEDYSNWYLPTLDPMTEEQAGKEAWEVQCDTASSYGDPDYEEDCEECRGDGEDDAGTTCEVCGGEGQVLMDEDCQKEVWAQFVDENSYCYMERYDPEIHFAVESEFPEHLAYAREEKMKALEHTIQYQATEEARLRTEMEMIGERLMKAKQAQLDARLELTKMENE